MKNQVIRYLNGYVKIRLESVMPERFVRLCIANQINLWNLLQKDGFYECELSVKDFFRIAPFRRKTSAHIIILEKHGLPFLFQAAKKRKAFFLGLLLFFFLLYYNSTILWDIRVNGNSFYSDETILEELCDFQVISGMYKSELNCKEIAAQIRSSFPNVVWVSAKLEGCCLLLDIKENENPNEKNTNSEGNWNLVAQRGGEIVKIATRKGVPLVSEGDICEAGDILVQGIVEILNQDLQVQRLAYVGADADIIMKTTYSYYDEFCLHDQQKIYRDYVKKIPVLRFGDREITYVPQLAQNQEKYFEEIPLFITDSFPLPISFGMTQIKTYELVDRIYTKEEAKQIANWHLQRYLEEMVAEGMIILEKQITFSIHGNRAVAKGHLLVLESPIVKMEISDTLEH